MAYGSQGIQGQDIIPRELLDDYAELFSNNLPGWTITGEYNYHAAPSTQVAAVQMQRILHSGQHPWINDQLRELLNQVESDINNGVTGPPTPTQRLAALVNYMQEAQNLENLDNPDGKTGGYVAFANRRDPHLIDHLDKQPDVDWMRANAREHLTWDKILASPAGREALELNPRVSNGALFYDGRIENGGFFSKFDIDIGTWTVYGAPGDKLASARFSEDYATRNNIKIVENGAVRLCCTNPVRDSSCESSVVAGLHEQTHTRRLQDQELARLQRCAQAPWFADDLVRSRHDLGGCADRQTRSTA